MSWEGQHYRLDFAASEAARLRRFREHQGGPSIDLALTLHRFAQDLPLRAAALAERLLAFVDWVLADALVSFSYAADWTDPQGARMSHTVTRRHDFGFAKTTDEARVRTAWALPVQVSEHGAPWHVVGSVLGLDVALAPLALRRIDRRVADRAVDQLAGAGHVRSRASG